MSHTDTQRIRLGAKPTRLARHLTRAEDWRAALETGATVVARTAGNRDQNYESWQEGRVKVRSGNTVTICSTDGRTILIECDIRSRFIR